MNKYYLLLTMMLFCAAQLIAQAPVTYSWSNVAIGGGGFVSGIITSKKQPGLIYARTDVGGAYRWDTANSKWIPLTDFASDSQQGIFGVESIAIDPQFPNIVYMSTGISYFNSGKSYILRSSDYGATFSITDVTAQFKINGNAAGRQDGERLQVDPVNSSQLYCGTRASGLFQSNDSGNSWNRMNSLNVTTTNNGNGVNFVVLDSTSKATVGGIKKTQRMFVGVSRTGNNNLYKSEDGGLTFTALTNPNIADTTQMPHRGVLSGNGYLYVTYSNGAGPGGTTVEPCNSGQIWKYNIANSTWTNVTPLTASNRIIKPYCGLSIDPGNPNRLIASTTNNYSLQYSNVYGDKIYYSADGGSNWVDIASGGFTLNANGIPWITGQSIHWAGSIEFDPSNTNRVFISSGNGVFVNNDVTTTSAVWNFAAKGIEETVAQNMVSIPGGPVISVIGDYDGFTQTDPLQYALQRHTPTMGSTSGLDYAVTSKKVVRVASSIYYSTDLGITWTKSAVINGSSGQIALSADGNTYLHCPSNSAITYRSTDNGTTWTNVNGLAITGARPVADGSNSGKFYAYNSSNGAVMVSTDGGVSFNTGATLATGGSKIIRTIPGREGHIWVALYGSGLTHSEDSGVSFTQAANISYCGSVGIGKALTPGGYETIYIYGTANGILGIHRSTDKGATWVRVNDDNHQYGGPANGQFVQGDMNLYGRVYMSTAGRGIICGTAVVVNHAPTDIALATLNIVQNNAIGAAVDSLSATDQDLGSTFTYSLVSGAGSTDNAAFTIAGSQLKAAVVFNSSVKSAYNIRVRVTDNGGLTFEKAFIINIVKVFTLPVNNFNVSVSNETCSSNNDGKINITASQPLSYTATLTAGSTNTVYSFTNSLEISSLNAGAYSLCITIAGQPNYQQCYSLKITEPQPLTVYSNVNLPDKVVSLNLGGATSYQISVNGTTFSSTADVVKVNLANGRNDISVTTDKDCQGTFQKTIFLEDGKRIYPNPFDSELSVSLGTDASKYIHVNLYSAYGVTTYSQDVKVDNGTAHLYLSNLKSGVYIIKIKTDMSESSTKILKK